MSKGTVGRGFLSFAGPGEQGAFCAWMSTMIADGGGKEAVAAKAGIHKDTLAKYVSGRSIPSRDTLDKLMYAGVITGYSVPEEIAVSMPWMEDRFIQEAKSRKIAAPKTKTASTARAPKLQAPAPNGEITRAPEPELIGSNLMDAIMTEPHITAVQRAQLAALAAMIVNGVDIDISIQPRR